jgi:Kef-type K+ transport system membrane component KefB
LETSHALQLLTTLFLMFVAAKVMAEVFERLKQPAVAGEILAGIVIGPALLNWVQPTEITAALAEIGVILLMFAVGLETEPRGILAVGKTAMAVAVAGVIIPFVLCAGRRFGSCRRCWGNPCRLLKRSSWARRPSPLRWASRHAFWRI